MIRRMAQRLVRGRWWVLAGWLVAAGLLGFAVPPADPRLNEPVGFLPDDLTSQQAQTKLAKLFPQSAGMSQAVVVIERQGASRLTAQDLNALGQIARRIKQPADDPVPMDLAGLSVLSPTGLPDYLARAMISPEQPGQGQAALLIVQIPASFITLHATDVVDHVERIIQKTPLPAGLEIAVTGSAGFGHDYAAAVEASNRRTLWVTVAAVLAILLLVYRAPLGAAMPLATVSLAAVAATGVLAACTYAGLHVGAGEKIFVYVLLYGAGVDYSLFFIARFAEYLQTGLPKIQAVAQAWVASAPAIAASAATTIAGLLMLALARYRIFHQVGPAVAIALTVALAACLTLVPALAAIFGRRLFWPGRLRGLGPNAADDADEARPPLHAQAEESMAADSPAMARHEARFSRFWSAVGGVVTRRPVLTLLVALVALGLPASRVARTDWVYDTLADLKPSYSAVRGADIIKRHWPVGELGPVTVLVELPAAARPGQMDSLAQRLTQRLLAIPGVRDVRSLSQPVGQAAGPTSLPSGLEGLGIRIAVRSAYATLSATRLEVILEYPPFSLGAMSIVPKIDAAVREALPAQGVRGPRSSWPAPRPRWPTCRR